MSPEQVREEQQASRDDKDAPPPPVGAYRPWDEAGRPEPHEAEQDR